MAALAILLLGASPAAAQLGQNNNVISPGYFATFGALYSGDYGSALSGFQDAGRGAIHTADARWIDSICYHTMTGEVFLQTGQPAAALEQYTSALQLYLQYSDWMLLVQFPPTLGPRMGQVSQPPWGQSQRRFRLGQFQEMYNITRSRIVSGQLNGQTVLTQQNMLQPLQVSELVRCTALAIRRRAELLGPVSEQDRLTQEVLSKLAGRPGPPNHWSDVWIDLQLGMALSAAGRVDQAVSTLTRSLVAANEFDHPLTGMAELELGRIALNRGDFKTAGTWFAEASYSGYYFSQPDVIEEALYDGALVHILTEGKGIYPPLPAAVEWARARHLRTMQTALLTMEAENLAVLGDTRQATAALSQASRTGMSRRDLASSALGSHVNYVTALVGYLRHQTKSADNALAAAVAFQKKASPRLFHMQMVDEYFREGAIRDRLALDLYAQTLDEPAASDWQRDPLDSLTVLLNPQETLMEHWFLAALMHDDAKTAVEIADRVRRRRFYSTLPLGGRLLSLRWVLEAPESVLPRSALLIRNELLARNPHFKDRAKQTQMLLAELKDQSPQPEDRAEGVKQGKLLSELARASFAQEGALAEMALRRIGVDMVFPPQRPLDDVQQRMRPGQAILAFLNGRHEMYGFLITPTRVGAWKIASVDAVKKRLGSTLRAMGLYDQSREVDSSQLKDQSWRGEAAALLQEILKDSKIDLGTGIEELVIVPDDFMWYVPFEALQIGKANQTDSILSKMTVRYAPTIGLAVPSDATRRQAGTTGVVMGRLYPREPEDFPEAAFKRIHRAVPQGVAITKLPSAPSSLLAKRLDALVVLDDLTGMEDQNPYTLRPMRLDRGRSGGSLADWFALPFSSPEVVLLPGFHTPAENGLKKLSRTARPGDDMFLTVCGLMSTGTRTILISRWRTGGRTCYELMAELLQELPNTSAADAWQRAVEVARQTPLDTSLEPRVKVATDRDVGQLTADHPFFWSGYALIDSGGDPRPKPTQTQPAQPLPQLKFPGKN